MAASIDGVAADIHHRFKITTDDFATKGRKQAVLKLIEDELWGLPLSAAPAVLESLERRVRAA